MNTGWSIFIIVVTIANILGCWWLLHWSSKHKADIADSDTTGHRWDGDLQELNKPLPRWWLILFNITIVFGLVYLVLYPGLGNFEGVYKWTQDKRYQSELQAAEAQREQVFAQFAEMDFDALVREPAALQTGQRIFANHCAMCHGSDARGAPGFPNLRDQDWLYGSDADALHTSIADGRQGVMPPFGSVLGEQGIWETVAYVQSLSGQNASPGLVEKGKAHYQALCIACHGPEGRGNQILGAPNLTDDIWLHGGSPDSIAAAISEGRTNRMPPHKELIGEQRVPLVAAYVASLSAADADHGQDEH